MRRSWGSRAIAIGWVGAGLIASCGGSTSQHAPTCTAGETESCVCDDGAQGVRSCADDGSEWGECRCSSDGGSGTAGSQSGVDHAGGASGTRTSGAAGRISPATGGEGDPGGRGGSSTSGAGAGGASNGGEGAGGEGEAGAMAGSPAGGVQGAGGSGGVTGAGGDTTGSGGAGVGGGSGLGGTGGDPPTGSGGCAGNLVPVELERVDLFIMLDKSISMAEERLPDPDGPTRWDVASQGLEAFANSTRAAGVYVGIGYFPLPPPPEDLSSTVSCLATDYATPDVELGPLPDNAAALVTSVNAQNLGSLTPSYPALAGALEHAHAWSAANAGQPTSVVFVTDGYPSECSPSSADDLAALTESYAAPTDDSLPIRTHAVDFSGGLSLDVVAESGGTGVTHVVDDGDAVASFTEILIRIAEMGTCEIHDVYPDPVYDSFRYVAHGEGPVELRLVSGADACSSTGYYLHPDDGSRVVLCPLACIAAAGTSIGWIQDCATEELD